MSAVTKATRLREQGKVREVEARTFRVEGDHGTYLTVIAYEGEQQLSCTCPARGACSHLLAAAEMLEAEAEEAERVRDVVAGCFDDRFGGAPAVGPEWGVSW